MYLFLCGDLGAARQSNSLHSFVLSGSSNVKSLNLVYKITIFDQI